MIPNMFKYFVFAMMVQVVWGFTPSASKIILEYLPVELFGAIRFTVSGLIFLTFARLVHGRLLLKKGSFMRVAPIGVLTYALGSLGTLYGLRLGGVLNFSLASSINAVITGTIALVMLKEKAHPYFRYAGVLSVAGALLLFIGKHDISNLRIAGGSLALIWMAYGFEAIGLVFSRRTKADMPLSVYMAIAQLSGAAFLWGMVFMSNSVVQSIKSMPMDGWLALGYVCFISCCLCYAVLYWLLNHVNGHQLAFFDCFHTGVSALLGVIAFHEAMNGPMIAGGVVLICSTLLIARPVKKSQNPAPIDTECAI